MLSRVLVLVVAGFWQGVGVELSFFMLWVGWNTLHRKVSHKFDPEHLFHQIHDYFMN